MFISNHLLRRWKSLLPVRRQEGQRSRSRSPTAGIASRSQIRLKNSN
ncbi:MAG: hypothetical protein JGK24_04570 [Microcoleus sp. PH2017_29_MFU_D_A]|nr:MULTISPECIES: hypothetical protein [unclassified Microcoleus]MCC3602515.1 hypothetical protein [Microcoleus sp. PH2017_29_MFU_D_A]MCC3633669.1 hypothetical protein [Microcoleus sp. PH2017_37_MFU_D_B]